MNVAPPIPVDIPVVGISSLFSLDIHRILSLLVLVPTALRLRKAGERDLHLPDFLVLAWGVMHVLQFVPPDIAGGQYLSNSATNILRETFLFLIDSYALYYVFSRSCNSRERLTDAMAAFCTSAAVLALIAIFESLKGWLVYTDVMGNWGGHQNWLILNLSRGGALRAQASAGHSIALGYLLAIGFGFWLSLKLKVLSKKVRIGGSLLYCAGLMAAYSRTPWFGALIVYFAFAALGRQGASRLMKAGMVFACMAVIISFTPLGDRIASVIPFLGGSVDAGNVTYREQLNQRSWELIQQNPAFGDQRAMSKMEDLRQGEGIIDLVNSYAGEALLHGCVALALWIGFFLFPLFRTIRTARRAGDLDSVWAAQGSSLAACMVGILVMLWSISFTLGVAIMFYVLAGLATAYSRVSESLMMKHAGNATPTNSLNSLEKPLVALGAQSGKRNG